MFVSPPRATASVLVLVPARLGPSVTGAVAAAWPDATVLLDGRAADRRVGDRRSAARPFAGPDRRRIARAAGRRVGERRAVLEPTALPGSLPLRLRRRRSALRAARRVPLAPLAVAGAEGLRALVGVQGGDRAAFAGLYEQWFGRVHAYVRLSLGEPRESLALVQQAFVAVLDDASGAPAAPEELGAWIVDHVHAVAGWRLQDGRESQLRGRRALPQIDADHVELLSDPDVLLLLVEVPLLERRTLLLRHVVGLDGDATARALGLDAARVAALERDGAAALRRHLERLGGAQAYDGSRIALRAMDHNSPVLRARRRALALSSF